MTVLLYSALTIGLIHTVIGPDHYLPFIVLGRAEGWTVRKTVFWTALCGVGHVLSSVLLGALGVALGWAVSSMERFEAVRGEMASLVLIGFGVLYFLWGLWKARRGHGHVHAHVHADGSVHTHAHQHAGDEAPRPTPVHAHRDHDQQAHVRGHRRTAWTLFIIFVLGPCEPLVPLLMVPAAQHSALGVAAVAAVFSLATIATMIAMVLLGTFGVQKLRVQALEPYSHALAGFAILASGLAIKVLGL